MRKKQASVQIQTGNSCHLVIRQSKIEHIEVLRHALLVYRFRNRHYTLLKQETQSHLCNRFSSSLTDRHKNRIGEKTVAPFGKRTPRHDLYAVTLHYFLRSSLLVEDVRFHLIDHWRNVAKFSQIHQSVRIKIADTNSSCLSDAVSLFHGSIASIIIVEGLVNEQPVSATSMRMWRPPICPTARKKRERLQGQGCLSAV